MQDVRTQLVSFMEQRGVQARVEKNRRCFRGILPGEIEIRVEDDPLRWPGSAWLNIGLGFLTYAPHQRWAQTETLLRRNMTLIHQFHAGIKTSADGAIDLVWRAGPDLISAAHFNRQLARLLSLAQQLRRQLQSPAAAQPIAGAARFL